MSQLGFVVPPMRKRVIYDIAKSIRSTFSPIITSSKVPIDVVYELLPDLLEGFRLEICDERELGNDHGRTYPGQRRIQLREDVYDGMCRGSGRDRFTGAHELGHLFLHSNIPFARTIANVGAVKLYCDSEWQANTFASAFLIDESQLISTMHPHEVAEQYGVSIAAASVRLKK